MRIIAYIYKKQQGLNLNNDHLKVNYLLENPHSYLATISGETYELLTTDSLQDYTSEDIRYFMTGVASCFENPTFVDNKAYENFGFHNFDTNGTRITFERDGIEFAIYTTFEEMEKEFPKTSKYLVFYDKNGDDNAIQSVEMPGVMDFFLKGMDLTRFDGIAYYAYYHSLEPELPALPPIEKNVLFSVFYYGGKPSNEQLKNIIREHLVDELGFALAKERFPNLFLDYNRKIFPMYNHRSYPINVETLNKYIADNAIENPEVILMLDWVCPIVVENGVSDVIENYSPVQIEGNIESNEFLFILSAVINYMEGRLIDQPKITRYQINFNTDSITFVFKNVQWTVMANEYYSAPLHK